MLDKMSEYYIWFLLLISFGSVKTEGGCETGSGRLKEKEDLASKPLSIADGGYGNCSQTLKPEDLENCTEKCERDSDCFLVNTTDFQYVNESTVFLNGNYFKVLLNSSQGLVVSANICQNETSPSERAPYSPTIELYIGNTLSILGYSLILLTFSLFKELRTCPAKIMAIAAVAIIASNIIVILGHSSITGDSGFCKVVAIFLHFFLLSHYTWTTILLFEVCYSFYRASRLIPVHVQENTRCKHIMYSTVSTIPLMIVAPCVILSYTAPDVIQYGRNFRFGQCWFIEFASSMVALIVPAIVLFVFQLVFFVVGSFLLATSSKGGNTVKRTPYVRILFAVFFSSHIIWLVVYVVYFSIPSKPLIIFFILSSTQGFVIFFGFYGTKKVWKLYTSLLSSIMSSLKS